MRFLSGLLTYISHLIIWQHTPRSSNQPFGFEIMINAQIMDAPVLCCAAESEEDFMMWMSALTSVIDGSLENQGGNNQEALS